MNGAGLTPNVARCNWLLGHTAHKNLTDPPEFQTIIGMQKTSTFLFVVMLVLSPTLVFGAKLSKEDVNKKKEGWYPTGLPLLNFSTDAGFGYGVRVFGYDNGEREDEHFEDTPYFTQIYGQFFQTTGGQAYHKLNIDMPYVAGSDYRLRARVEYAAVLNANYFGHTAASADAGLTDGEGQTYENWTDYNAFLSSGGDEASLRKFNNYQRRKFYGLVRVSRSLFDWLEVEIGLELGNASIQDWHGESFTQGELEEVSAATRLSQDRNSLVGYEGGWVNFLHLGLRLDERDFEPNPKTGYLAEYNLDISGPFVGSDFNFVRQTFSVRGFYTFWDRLTLAGRLAMTYASGDVPFFEMGRMMFMGGEVSALGGIRSARGFVEERFLGRGYTLAQVDLRYFVGDVEFGGQLFGLQPFAFFDAGNVYDTFGDMFVSPRFASYKPSYGGGIMIPWNLATLIHVFTGFSPEGMSMSISFEHAF